MKVTTVYWHYRKVWRRTRDNIEGPRLPLRDKVTLRLLKIIFHIADVAECSKALDIRVGNWCCSVSIV